jgi:hypothetical protein
MIDFKNKDELPTNVVICASLVAIAIAAACILFLPKPVAPSSMANLKERSKVSDATKAMEQEIAVEKGNLAQYTWPGKLEDVGPIALKQVNALLQSRHLKLVGFHSQKAIEEANITEIPFIVSVDGGFSNVMAFTKDLEKANTKLVVNLFQISNADQTTDKVTASIGIMAYQLPQPVAAPATPSKNSKGVKKNA